MTQKSTGATALVAASALMAGGAQAESLIIAHGFPPTHTYVADGITPWAACVEAATNGELTFENFPSGQISGHADGTHSLEAGIAQIVGIPPAYESEKFPLNTIAQLPGIAKNAVQVTAAYVAMLENGSPMEEEWKGLNAKPFLSMLSAPYQLMTAGDPIDSMDKFDGVKIRAAAGPMTFAVEALGATPVTMASSDMYVALQRGTIDGTVLANTSAPAYKLDEVVNSISTNGAFAFAHTVWAIDQGTFDGLSEAHQTAIMDCGRQIQEQAAVILDESALKIADEYAANGVTFYAFPPDMLEEVNAALSGVADTFIEELEGRGLAARKAYDMLIEAVGKTEAM